MKNKRISATLLTLCVLLSFGLFTPNVLAFKEVQHLGRVEIWIKPNKVYRQDRFVINGSPAFCIDYGAPAPKTGNQMSEGQVLENESIRAILYYGYDGIENQIGESDNALIATSLALDTVMHSRNDPDRSLIPGYDLLMEHARKQDAPHDGVQFLDAIIYLPCNKGQQRLCTLDFPDPLPATAPPIPAVSGAAPVYKPITSIRVLPPRHSDEPERRTFRFTVTFADRKDGRILNRQTYTEQKRLGSSYGYVAPGTCGTNGDGTYKLISEPIAKGYFSGSDIEITFYYDLWVPAKIEHRDARTGRLLDTFTEEKRRDDGFSYAPRRDLKAGKYTYRPVANADKSAENTA